MGAGAHLRHIEAGAILHRAGDTDEHLELVVSGLVRVFVAAVDGRTLTVRYCRPGALLGVASLYAPTFSLPGTIQALATSETLALQPRTVRNLVREDPAVAQALLVELSDRVAAFIAEIPGSAFASVRQRVCRHLLDLASEQQHSADLVASISQQDLADAVGSVREVVVRVLRELREDGIVETNRGGIRIREPERLADEALRPG